MSIVSSKRRTLNSSVGARRSRAGEALFGGPSTRRTSSGMSITKIARGRAGCTGSRAFTTARSSPRHCALAEEAGGGGFGGSGSS